MNGFNPERGESKPPQEEKDRIMAILSGEDVQGEECPEDWEVKYDYDVQMHTGEALADLFWKNPEQFLSGVRECMQESKNDHSSHLGKVLDRLSWMWEAIAPAYNELKFEADAPEEMIREFPHMAETTARSRKHVQTIEHLWSEVRASCEELLAQPSLSYFSELRIREAIEALSKDWPTLWSGEDDLPFELAPGLYGRHIGGQLLISSPANANLIKAQLAQYEAHRAEGFLNQKIEDQLNAYCDQPLKPGDITLEVNEPQHLDNKELQNDYDDFQYILRSDTRALIEDQLGIDLTQCTLQEQFYFLRHIKSANRSYIQQIKTFHEEYGIDGLRTFLATGYDDKMADRIQTFAALTEPETVREVFAQYTNTLDNAEKLKGSLKESLKASGNETESIFADQLFEAYVRRSAHLFFAAEQMATYGYDTATSFKGETMTDLQHSFEGVATMTGVLVDVSRGDKYEVAKDEARTRGNNIIFSLKEKNSENIFTLKVFIRPHAEHNKKRNETYQARINLELSFDDLPAEHPLRTTFFSQTQYKQERKCIESSTLRLAFDLDDAFDPPRLSFDMGRNERDSQKLKRTGDALGRILDRVGPEGHHLFASFGDDLSKPEHFEAIALAFKKYFEQAIHNSSS